jgi:hypothetical protein
MEQKRGLITVKGNLSLHAGKRLRRNGLMAPFVLNPLTQNDLQRRRAVSPLKIKITCTKISAGSVARRDLFLELKG